MTAEFELPQDRADLEELHDRFDGERQLCPGEVPVPGGWATVAEIAVRNIDNVYNGGPSVVDVADRVTT